MSKSTPRSELRRRIATGLLCLPLTLPLAGCGSLMFAERNGQEPGKLDPNVVLLDGIGLIFFIVPGLVAYGVDFATGAIYLPDGVEKGEGPFWRDPVAKQDVPENRISNAAAPRSEDLLP
jgi:hypothetical protein